MGRDALARVAACVSKVDRQERTLPRWGLVTHLFDHQVHHRGQVTTLLSPRETDVGAVHAAGQCGLSVRSA